MQQRTAKDIWQNLHEFLLYETSSNPEWNTEKINLHLQQHFNIPATGNLQIIRAQKQLLTHQVIYGYFIYVELNHLPKHLDTTNSYWLSVEALQQKAFPQFLNQFIQKKALQLQVF